MIHTNLSTRPFYNEGAAQLWLLVVACVLAAAAVFNVRQLLSYSRSDTELATEASRDEDLTAKLRASAASLRGSVDSKQIDAASAEAREANALIDRRTFSWTELFNRFEGTVPDDVRITSVRPRLDPDRGIVLAVTVLARGVDDVNRFMDNLEATGAFSALLSREEHINDAGQLQAALETVYHPHPLEVPSPASSQAPGTGARGATR